MTSSPPRALAELMSGAFAPQRAFSYPIERWRSWTGPLDGVGPLLDRLPKCLDRGATAKIVDAELTDNIAGAFAVAMIWGHGWSGYGPYRTASILTGTRKPRDIPTSADVLDRLRESVGIARDDGAVEGYRYLNNRSAGRIVGLGPAFFTKWLYFVTARGDQSSEEAAPVLDALVIRWLRESAGISIRPGQTSDYEHYVNVLTAWGTGYNLTAVQVEERIFRLIRDDGAPVDPPVCEDTQSDV